MLTIILGVAAAIVIMGLIVMAMRAGHKTDREGTGDTSNLTRPLTPAHSRISGADD